MIKGIRHQIVTIRKNLSCPRGQKRFLSWQGHKDLNPEPTVLETAALPIELYPYMVGLRGLEPRTDRL